MKELKWTAENHSLYISFKKHNILIDEQRVNDLNPLYESARDVTYLLTYLLYGAESFLRS